MKPREEDTEEEQERWENDKMQNTIKEVGKLC